MGKIAWIKSYSGWKPLLWLALAILLTACDKTKPPQQLTFADPGNPIASLVYIAESKGFFKNENLSISYKKFTSGRDAINSLLSAESDVAIATEFPFANNILAGKALKILCTVERTNQNAAVVARVDRGIREATDLAGKRIGLAPNTNSDYMLSIILREAGIADEAVDRSPLKPEEMADALERGEVDAVATWSPHVANSQARFPKDAIVTIRSPAYTELSLLGTRPDVVTAKSEALQRLVRALVRAEDFVLDKNAEALQIVAQHLGEKYSSGLHQDWPGLKFQVRLDNLLLTSLTNEGRWLAKRVTPQPVVPDYRSTFVPAYLETERTQSVTVSQGEGY